MILLTGIVLGAAVDFYLDLSRSTQRAADGTREVRRAAALLDRVARDLQSTVLVAKPPAADPLSHPWVFLAEGRYADAGSDRIKFMTRGREVHRSDAPESDFAVVAYLLQRSEDDAERYELRRWSSPRLPDGLDREFPPAEGTQLVADGVESFSLRFMDQDGAWVSDWDSSQLVESSELPLAVEVEVSLAEEGVASAQDWEAAFDAGERPRYARTVVLPLPALDMTPLLPEWAGGAPAGSGEGSEGDEEGEGDGDGDGDPERGSAGRTLGDCIVSVPHGQTPLGEAWADFVAKNSHKPLSAHRWLFADEHLRPECR